MTAKLIKIFTFNKIGMQENDTALLMIERSVREGCIPSCCRELDSECRAFAYF